jgi:tetratricopeptide (TPR) repeat protein
MTAKLRASLLQAPATVPAATALVVFVAWATDQAGYPLTHWAPGGVLVLALLAIAAWAIGARAAEVPLAVKVALGCLAAYTAVSFLSILWAGVPGDAWEGADRTLLYLAVLALFAWWRQRGATAAALLASWVLAMIGLAAYVALHLDAAGASSLRAMLPGGRLIYPSGYPNANAAQWLMAFWPALLLARGARLPWALRGLLAGGAVLLADVALLSQSRGSLYATPVMLVLVFALLPERVRTFAVLVPVAAAVGASAPVVLRVGDHLNGGFATAGNVHAAVAVAFVAAAVSGAIVALGSALEARRVFAAATGERIRRGIAVVAVLSLVAVVAGGLVAAGNPVTRVRNAWHSFKGGYGSHSGSRLVSGLGSNRYDFYRVALDEFTAHPVLGIGADNYQQAYLLHGRSSETPRYPHSVELRTLTETGLVGTLLALVGLGAALLAAARPVYRVAPAHDPLAATAAAAALSGFAYWVVHGSFDWFWEFAGLGAPAFAMLGLACALGPRRAAEREPAPARARLRSVPVRRIVLAAAGLAATLAGAASLTLPWLSQLEVQDAARIWTRAPAAAYARLHEAARLNQLSDEPYVVAGSIALRYGELTRADGEFARALERTPDDVYALLERGAIASSRGRARAALSLLEEAVRLDPREGLARDALALVRAGHRVDIGELNRAILLKATQLS